MWAETNHEQKKSNCRKWYFDNQERADSNHKKWTEANPERNKSNWKKWRKTPEGKMAEARRDAKRRFLYPLKTIWGRPLKGLVLHHMTKDTGVYIPEWLHRSIPHCLETGKNMDKINAAAMEWYERGGPITNPDL